MLSLHEEEKILGVWRKAWFIFALSIGSYVSLALAPLVAMLIADAASPQVFRGELLPFWIFLGLLWWLAVWIWFFKALVDYYLDVFVLTNERIIHITQRGFFNRETSELRLSRIQDVSITVAGLFPTLLHYGDVRVQTAGEIESFIFYQIPRPANVKDLIMKAHRDYIYHERGRAHEMATNQP